MTKVLTFLPIGERVGIVFSGGLDTSVAVAWVRELGAIPCTYTVDVGQHDETDIASVPDRAEVYGTEISRLMDCKEALVAGGLSALACGTFHIRSEGRAYFNTTPIGRVVTGTLLVRAMAADDVSVWGDGSTYKGNDIEHFYRYGLMTNPELRIYGLWLDEASVSLLGDRAEMSAWLVERGLPYRDSEEEAYSTDADIWGATHEAKTLEDLDVSLETVEPIMGAKFWGPAAETPTEDVSIRFEQGQSVTVNGRRFDSPVALMLEANVIGDRHGLGMSDQIENRITEAKSCSVYKAPDMALLWITCERLLAAIHNEDTLTNYRSEGLRLGRLLYEGRWLNPQSLMLRGSIQRWAASAATGEADLRLRRDDNYTIPNTRGPNLFYQPEKLSMERVKGATFGPTDRIGQFTMRNLDIADSRERLELYASQGMLLAGHVNLIGTLKQGGTAKIAALGSGGTTEQVEDAALRSAMDFGTDQHIPLRHRVDQIRYGLIHSESLFRTLGMSRFLKSQAWRPTGLLMAYGALTFVWVVLWRFPVLMADDRFFAIASEPPRGQQTWAVIEKMFDDCWRLISGHLADDFGAMLFALGDTALRLAMALFYVALTAILWCYLRLSAETLRRPLPRSSLGAGSDTAWVCWSLAAIWPFTLISLSTGVAGKSVMLMAAVWNYMFPLTLLLFALYPLFRRRAGRPMP